MRRESNSLVSMLYYLSELCWDFTEFSQSLDNTDLVRFVGFEELNGNT